MTNMGLGPLIGLKIDISWVLDRSFLLRLTNPGIIKDHHRIDDVFFLYSDHKITGFRPITTLYQVNILDMWNH